MLTPSLMTLMSRRDDSSAGASLGNYTKRSSQNPWRLDDGGTVGLVTIGWTQAHPGAKFHHEVTLEPQGTATAEERDALLYRWMCHVLIDRMPIASMAESFNCLHDTFEWSGILERQRFSLALPPKKSTRARVGSRRERPEFHAEE